MAMPMEMEEWALRDLTQRNSAELGNYWVFGVSKKELQRDDSAVSSLRDSM